MYTCESRHVASLPSGLTLIGPVVVGNVGNNSVSSYRLHAYETQQMPCFDGRHHIHLCEVARAQPLTNDGPTCNTP